MLLFIDKDAEIWSCTEKGLPLSLKTHKKNINNHLHILTDVRQWNGNTCGLDITLNTLTHHSNLTKTLARQGLQAQSHG